jgi:hypothetical protein
MVAAAALAVAMGAAAMPQDVPQTRPPAYRGRIIPLCPGLTIVTAINQLIGDYESIKRIESATADAIRVRYSSYQPDPKHDYDSTNAPPAPWVPYYVFRTIRTADLDNATAYQQQFATGIPETIKNTTALGISARVYRTLKEKRQTPLVMYLPLVPGSIDENGEPALSLMEYRMTGEIDRADLKPSTLSVLVNDRLTPLPVLHAKGSIGDVDAEFFFLDDPDNPLALKFAVGTDALNIIKIDYQCAAPLDPAASAGGTRADFLERALSANGRVDVYSLYFAFNSDVIREESEPTLREVAAILKKHPDWKLSIVGHTDNIASDSYNLELSRRRAAAVKKSLQAGQGIAGDRLTTDGLGKSHPKDTNDTLEGRARNRRVELVRVP